MSPQGIPIQIMPKGFLGSNTIKERVSELSVSTTTLLHITVLHTNVFSLIHSLYLGIITGVIKSIRRATVSVSSLKRRATVSVSSPATQSLQRTVP